MQNNITQNENNIIQEEPSYEVSFSEHPIKKEFEVLSKDKQLFSNEAITQSIPLGQDNLFENSTNVIDFSNQNGEQLNTIPFLEEGNQVNSNINTNNLDILRENINGTIGEAMGNNEQLDFLKTTSEQYTTEEIPKINAPKIFTSKILDDSKKIVSSYSIGHPEVANTFPLTENLITTTGDVQAANTYNIKTNMDNKIENEIKPQNIDISVNSSTDISKNPNIDKKIDLSNPKIAELVKKYRTEVVVEPREEVKYIPVKKVKYVKILKVYVPKVKKVYVPGKKVVVPIKKKVYVQKPKNLQSSQMTSKISTSTKPIMTTSTYVNPYSARTNHFSNTSINKMTQSINSNVNNSQLFGLSSINPSMSLIQSNKSLQVPTKVIEIPLTSSNSSSNILQSSTNFGAYTGKSMILNYSYVPRVYSRSLSRSKINNYYYEDDYY